MRTGDGVYYELTGSEDGPALVMLRGLGRFSLHWGPLVESLEPRFRLVLIDNRGVGRSAPVRWPFSVADLADDVARVLDHAGIGRAHLFGLSLGGMIALRFAIDHGGRLDRLVLGATSAGGAAKVLPPMSPILRAASARFRSRREGVEAEARLALSEARIAADPAVVQGWVDLAEQHPASTRILVLQLLAAARHDASGELDRITAPTLVVSCEEDHLVPPENSRILARRIPHAELAWLPGAAHDITTEHPDRVAALLEEFLLAPMRY